MRKQFVLIFLFISNYVSAQPGPLDPFGGYTMSFILLEDDRQSVVTPENKKFTVSYSANTLEGYKYFESLNFNLENQQYYHPFRSSRLGADIPRHFTLHIVSSKDTMIIYSAENIIRDSIQFRKGEYIACEQYIVSKSITSYHNTQILNKDILDFEKSQLPSLPYFQIRENGCLKLEGIKFDLNASKQLPNRKWIVHGKILDKVFKGNVLKDHKGKSGSYSPSTNLTQIDDLGMAYTFIDNPGEGIINYDFENLDTLLMGINGDFSLKEERFQKYFPIALNWEDTNSVCFAILTDLQALNDSLWTITINSNLLARQVYISRDKGITWIKSFSCESPTSKLNLYSFQNEVYAFTSNKIFHSKTQENDWSALLNEKTLENIRDLIIINDTLGFCISQTIHTYDLISFNPQTGEFRKVLNSSLRQAGGKGAIFYSDKKLIMSVMRGFLVSEDLGLTWTYISNEGMTILKDSVIWSCQKQVVKMRSTQNINDSNYGHQYSETNEQYYIRSFLNSQDNKLELLYLYDQYNKHPYFMISELTFSGL